MAVTRYEPIASYVGAGEFLGDAEECALGEFVLYSDYAELERERDELAARAEKAERENATLCAGVADAEQKWEAEHARATDAERERDEARKTMLKVLKWVPNILQTGWTPEVQKQIDIARDSGGEAN